MFSTFTSLKALYDEAKAAASTLSLDNLQGDYGVDTVKESLKALDLTYLTPRVIAMGFPSTPDTRIRSRNDAQAVSTVLRESHGSGHVMVWNLSDEAYDYALFDNQVVEVCCEGSPAPPLGLMVKVCSGIESWLAADPSNVAAIHCMTGKGRTAATAACALTWMGLYDTPTIALEDVAKKRGGYTAQQLCSPSQIRYVGYFGSILEGVRPRQPGSGVAPDLEALGAEASAAGRAAAEAEIGGGALAAPLTPPLTPPQPPRPILRKIILHGIPDMSQELLEWEAVHGVKPGEGSASGLPLAGRGEREREGGEVGNGGGEGEDGERKGGDPFSSSTPSQQISLGLARLTAGIDAYLISPMLGPAEETEDEGEGAEERWAAESEERRAARTAARDARRAARAAARAAAAAEAQAAASSVVAGGAKPAAIAGERDGEGVVVASSTPSSSSSSFPDTPNTLPLEPPSLDDAAAPSPSSGGGGDAAPAGAGAAVSAAAPATSPTGGGGAVLDETRREALKTAARGVAAVARLGAADVADEAMTRAEDALDRVEDLAAAADKYLSIGFDKLTDVVSGVANKAIDKAAKVVQRSAKVGGGGGGGGGKDAPPPPPPGCRLELHVFSNGEVLWDSLPPPLLSPAKGGEEEGEGEGSGDGAGAGAGVAAAAASSPSSSSSSISLPELLPWHTLEESSVPFSIGLPLLGDLVVRCRHVRDDGGRETVFRCAIHTGFVSGYLLRLGKRQLDGAVEDPRVPSDFRVEFIWGPPEPLSGDRAAAGGGRYTISPYDAQFGEPSFWEDIEMRRKSRAQASKIRRNAAAAAAASSHDTKQPAAPKGAAAPSTTHSAPTPSEPSSDVSPSTTTTATAAAAAPASTASSWGSGWGGFTAALTSVTATLVKEASAAAADALKEVAISAKDAQEVGMRAMSAASALNAANAGGGGGGATKAAAAAGSTTSGTESAPTTTASGVGGGRDGGGGEGSASTAGAEAELATLEKAVDSGSGAGAGVGGKEKSVEVVGGTPPTLTSTPATTSSSTTSTSSYIHVQLPPAAATAAAAVASSSSPKSPSAPADDLDELENYLAGLEDK